MGLLIAKGDTILVERYQYGRTDTDRLLSFSMAKTIVGLLIGIAIEEQSIRSIDDLAEAFEVEHEERTVPTVIKLRNPCWSAESSTEVILIQRWL